MDKRDRKLAVDTACADLQAQLEASERTLRHIDDDVIEIDRSFADTLGHAHALGQLLRHTHDLRQNLREQRLALRLVLKETTALCEVLRETVRALAPSGQMLRNDPDK